jgi:hypothetical protein
MHVRIGNTGLINTYILHIASILDMYLYLYLYLHLHVRTCRYACHASMYGCLFMQVHIGKTRLINTYI